MLSRESWWPAAQHLEIGQKQRVPHDCGEGSPLIVSRDEEGYHAYCFRCIDKGWQPPPTESLADKVDRLKRQREGDTSLPAAPFLLPTPREYNLDNWPMEARLWIYKAGLSRADAGVLQLYWHAPSDRVVIPVLSADGGGSMFYQARAYQKGRVPKYLGPTPKPANLCARWGQYHTVSLTEDLLSAIKIGMAGGEGWCLLGTHVSDFILSRLLARKCRVLVCLDPDPPGQRGALIIVKQLVAYGVACTNVVMPKDPKLLHLSELKEYVCPSTNP